jgi:hypothetical protein
MVLRAFLKKRCATVLVDYTKSIIMTRDVYIMAIKEKAVHKE